MEVIETRAALAEALRPYRAGRIGIGFVPTMGALHAGHISLAERCRRENGITVASIFVNPAQFNEGSDFAAYPRTLDEDVLKLTSIGCDFLFAPDEKEMYPEEDTREFDFGGLDGVMEGACRPGHFTGVARIVSKLFDAVRPERAYFGEKDFQQLAIVRRMAAAMPGAPEIVGCPTVREADGLAMSSRNARLTPEQRHNASAIYAALRESRELIASTPLEVLKKRVTERIDAAPGLETEYFEIADGETLQPAAAYREHSLRGFAAVRAGAVRLIDNIAY